jgi:hypothetical protein
MWLRVAMTSAWPGQLHHQATHPHCEAKGGEKGVQPVMALNRSGRGLSACQQSRVKRKQDYALSTAGFDPTATLDAMFAVLQSALFPITVW